jgi:hypothetical protein
MITKYFTNAKRFLAKVHGCSILDGYSFRQEAVLSSVAILGESIRRCPSLITYFFGIVSHMKDFTVAPSRPNDGVALPPMIG